MYKVKLRSRYFAAPLLLLGSLALAAHPHSKKRVNSHLKLGPEVAVNDIGPWARAIKSMAECRPILEIPGAYICATRNLRALEELLGRANLYFVDKPTGLIASDAKVKAQDYAGFDISSDILENFYKDFDRACKSDPSLCPNELEKGLRDVVMKDAKSKKLDRFAIVAASIKDDFMWTINHELFHILYYTNAKYRKRVKEFWNTKLSEEERELIKKALSTDYNVSSKAGETLLINEFQAYTLQWGGWTSDWGLPFKSDHPVYRLREFLGDLIPRMPGMADACPYLFRHFKRVPRTADQH